MRKFTPWILSAGILAGMAVTLPAIADVGQERHRNSLIVERGKQMKSDASPISDDLKLRGSVVTTWSFMNFPGLYYIPHTPEGVFEQVEGASVVVEYGGYDDGEGKYYVAGLEDWGIMSFPNLTVYSTDTWEEIDWLDCDHTIICTDNATDPTTGDVYGCFYYYDEENNPHLAWAKGNYPAGHSEAVRVLGDEEQIYGVACDGEGQYYAVLGDGSLMAVEKTTGQFSKIGDTGLRPYYNTSATFDTQSGNIIFSYAPATGKSSLWAIDPSTAEATLLVEYVDNDQVTALEVVKPEAEPLAPAAPGLAVEAPDGGMEMHYTIVMPSTHFNGTPAEGELEWTLTLDGNKVADGKSVFGGKVEGTVTLETEGAHTVIAYVENANGRSPRTKQTMVNGAGIPSAPTGLGINNFGGGEIGLYWDAVRDSANDAYINPAAVTYSVTRNGEQVAEGLTDTWFDETVETPSTFVKLIYEVRAEYGGNYSEAASVSTGIGSLLPPYRTCWDTDRSDDSLYSIINVNGDSGYWWFSPSYASFIYDYSNENSADDWLISPAFHLENGKQYELSYTISGNSTMYTERYSVGMGVAPIAAAMVKELLPPTEISTERYEPIEMTLTVVPTSDGEYYFGWHALSDAGMFQIHLKDISLSSPLSPTSPTEATEITLTKDSEGLLLMHGEFRSPETDITGNLLEGLSIVRVTRDGKDEPVAEFTNVAPGSKVEFDDSDIPERGTYTYRIHTTASDGSFGREASASVYVGPVAPANVPSVSLTEDPDVPGRVILSWESPLTDKEGNELNSDNLTYMVYVAGEYGMAEAILPEPIKECTLRLDVCSPEEMEFAVFFVSALNLGLESEGLTRSPMIPVGRAENLPYLHSFTGEDLENHLLGYVATSGTYGSLSAGSLENDGIEAADGDDAFMMATQYEPGASIDFFTGKIDLGAAQHPALSLRHYKWSDADANLFTVYAITHEGTRIELGDTDHAAEGEIGWNVFVCPLDKVKGQVVELCVSALFLSHDKMPFDALSVSDMPAHDLAASSLSAPVRVEAAKEFVLTGKVTNMGRMDETDYTVGLLLNGETVDVAEGPTVRSGESVGISFHHILTPLVSAPLEFAIRVNLSGDEDSANDESPVACPVLAESRFPAVSDLTAATDDSGVVLTWSAPSTDGFEAKEVEDFEDAESWTEDVEGWTMIDLDGQQIGTLEGASLPDVVAMRTSHSFFVFDSSSDDIFFYNPALEYLVSGNSGSKSLVAMYILNSSVPQDDWAISPLLDGTAQTISFQARSFHPDYLDSMEVLYSLSDSTDPTDFISLCPEGVFKVPQLVDAIGNAAYTSYEFNLPEGTKRFALRAYNEGGSGFMLMIDDVKFRQANSELAVNYYDIYRDGVCINDAPVTDTSYVDMTAPKGDHIYNVVVWYNRGVSPASNNVSITTTGIGSLQTDGIRVWTENGVIVVSGLASDATVTLCAPDGRIVYSGTGDCRIPAPNGLYLLRAGDKSVKVLIQ